MIKPKSFIILLLFILAAILAIVPAGSSGNDTIRPGEYLEYEVTYMGLPLAKVTVRTEKNVMIGGRKRNKVKASVSTFDHVPMVDVNAVMQSWIDKAYGYSVKFSRNMKLKTGDWEYQEITFDYSGNMIYNKKWLRKKLAHSSRRRIKDKDRVRDPLALFCYTRILAARKSSKRVMTYFDGEPFYAKVTYSGKKDKTDTEGIGYPIRTVYVTGFARWEKGYGLTGKVEGWLSDDAASVPIKGKIDFILGKINIELVKYKRTGWRPPKA